MPHAYTEDQLVERPAIQISESSLSVTADDISRKTPKRAYAIITTVRLKPDTTDETRLPTTSHWTSSQLKAGRATSVFDSVERRARMVDRPGSSAASISSMIRRAA